MVSLPTGATTLIGSLPHKKIDEAFEVLNRFSLTIPAWPQFTHRSFKETIIAQFCEGLPGIVVNENSQCVMLDQQYDYLDSAAVFNENMLIQRYSGLKLTKDYAQGFHEFIEFYSKSEKLPFAKGQITGPYTMGLSIKDMTGRFILHNRDYRDILLQGLAGKAVWQVNQLKKIAETVIIFIDEPILPYLGAPPFGNIDQNEISETLNFIIQLIHDSGATAGIHSCANTDWSQLAVIDADIISFDAYYYGDQITLYSEYISHFLSRGGYLAWGIVPTSVPISEFKDFYTESADTLFEKIYNLCSVFVKKGIDTNRLMEQMLLTPSCGMKSLKINEAEMVLEMLLLLRKKMQSSILSK